MRMSSEDQKSHRAIYLLPNLFTTAALFAGFYAIVAAMADRFEAAAVAIFIAMVLDGVDGRVARMTNTQSAFGAEYDSLADMVSFGLAPALVMYQWALIYLDPLGFGWAKTGWLAAFLYTACAALRLARFNTKVGTSDKRFFQGLPSPTAAAVLMGMVWVLHDLEVEGETLRFVALGVTIIVGLLMVSNISYYSFKDIDFRNRVPFIALLLVVVVLVVASLDPPKILLAAFGLYTLSGPVLALVRWRRKRERAIESSQDSDAGNGG
ncbi:MAG TPA: CDP-diacylglycerol--serine O-phosphatidyltransferase [Thioalkalivibrio sp.]|nr:CDP-diacylglycerol--serine O-phosphatidyltransferase [Thioalkalivibrio sp.]